MGAVHLSCTQRMSLIISIIYNIKFYIEILVIYKQY